MNEPMKQHISKEQWDEVSDDDQIKLTKDIHNDYTIFPWELVTIGQMVEFLGDDWGISVMIYDESIEDSRFPENEELVSALWEAVKYKLKQ